MRKLILALMLVGFLRVEGQCRRRAPSTTDCSTTTGECNFIFNDSGLPNSLPFPPPNTRTCYRTCHDENGVCRSTPTVITEQKLAVQNITGDTKTYRIFSPNHGSGTYRKSTNCRYRVKCDPGQIISYSVIDFDLEESNTCTSGTECLDWVEITYIKLGTKKRFCGTGELGQVHVDGSDELFFEFVSNRQTQKNGFLFYVNCFDPASDSNAVRVGVVDPSIPSSSILSTNRLGNINTGHCSQPPNMANRPLALEVPNAFLPTTRRYTIDMYGSIYYLSKCIIIRNEYKIINIISGIYRLRVTNRITTTIRYFNYHSLGLLFKGYGTLVINGQDADFYQLGADPILQPTPEESEKIIEIERAINDLLPEDSFDVLDEYDIEEAIETFNLQQRLQTRLHLFPRRSLPSSESVPSRISELANTYGNACNGVLKSAACTLQALRGIDCNTGLAIE